MSYVPGNPNGQATMANSTPVVVASNQSALSVTGPLTDTQLRASAVPVSNSGLPSALGQTTMSASMPVALASNQSALAVSNSGLPSALGQTTMSASMPVTLASNQSALATTNAGIPTALGQAAAASSLAVTLSNENVQDLYFTGAAAQTATVNNIIPAASGAAATDATGYRSGSVQVVSSGTGGSFFFEQSNDNVNFQPLGVFSSAILTGQTIVTAITATSSQVIYSFPIQARYIRLRIATTITGGSIQAFTKLSQQNFTATTVTVAQNTAANLATTATIASGTVTTVSTVTALTAMNSIATTNGMSIGTIITPTTPATNSIKATAGRLHHMHVGNPNAAAVYLKVFNVAAPTLGTTSANMNYYIPPTSSTSIVISDQGLFFSTAIVTAVTGGSALADNTSIAAGCTMSYSWI